MSLPDSFNYLFDITPEWPLKRVDELCDVTRGASPRPIHEWIVPEGTPWIKIADATADPSRYITRTREFIRHEGRSKSVVVRPGDLILSNSATPGIPKILGIEACIHDGWLLLRNLRGIDPKFFYYIFLNDRKHLAGQGNGSIFTNLKTDIVKAHTLLLPPLQEQCAIAEVLGALDDKIAANTKLADTATGLMTTLLTAYPATVPISEIVEHRKTSTNPESMPVDKVAHFSLPAFDVDQSPEFCEPSTIKSNKFLIERPSVLISKLNPRFPRVWDVATMPDIPSLASTEFLVLEPKQVSTAVIWAMLSQPSFSASLETQVAGTSSSHQRVRPSDLLATLVPSPSSIPISVLAQVTAIGARVATTRAENRTLGATRDALLPQLMSGKLRVKEAQALVAAAV
ncbi:restriction endonuclease subunit S [Arthrobacter dokdonensis]|uniref:restriction endonuclease subunit S n=1 Tax=Arthrobacter dokdonellae TaxID=2211210 RepID=UPI000DE58D91|nr:restriction endonuclease subunit S [Arthrobacter dokdonellae]